MPCRLLPKFGADLYFSFLVSADHSESGWRIAERIVSQVRYCAALSSPKKTSYRWTLALAGVLALAVILPFLHFGQASGHDFEFHLESWMDVARQWRQGVLFPRWAVWANYGYGEPRFIFYPPTSWILGAALGSLLPWWAAPMRVHRFCHYAVERLDAPAGTRLDPPGAAVAAALFYAANPYQLLVIYLPERFRRTARKRRFPAGGLLRPALQ